MSFELFEAAEPAANRAEVRERATQPTIVDERHAAAQRLREPMASAACRFVPTNSTRLPCDEICERYFFARSRPRTVSRTSMM